MSLCGLRCVERGEGGRVGRGRAVAGVMALLLSSGANSAFAACVVANGVATCSGNLASGVTYLNLSGVTVEGLSNSIAPSAGRNGVSLLNLGQYAGNNQSGAAGLAGSIGIAASGFGLATVNAPAVELAVVGGTGGSGVGTTQPGGTTGQAGGAGGLAGAASVTVTADTLSATAAAGGPLEQGVQAYSWGGTGSSGESQPQPNSSTSTLTGGAGGAGGAGGPATVSIAVPSLSFSGPGQAVNAISQGGDGGSEQQILGSGSTIGGAGGVGGAGGNASILLGPGTVGLSVGNGASAGVLAQSIGGAGGNGMSAGYVSPVPGSYGAQGGNAGDGGDAGDAVISGAVSITAAAMGSFDAVRADSIGGAGGGGGNADNETFAVAGSGGVGGAGGDASIGTAQTALRADIAVTGDGGRGLYARSVGAPGGNGGAVAGSAVVGSSGAALGSGPGGAATINFAGSVTTGGDKATAVIAQSVGGAGPNGAGYAASAASAGAGGGVTVIADLVAPSATAPAVGTSGDNSAGLVAQSVGGGGGWALDTVTGLGTLGGTGLAGGDGGAVAVTSSGAGTLATQGQHSDGVYIESLGGGGGNAGPNAQVTGLGAAGGTGGDGGTVTASIGTAIVTGGDQSDGIVAVSRGGGGGAAFSTSGIEYIGGQAGGGGGDGGQVALTFLNAVGTRGKDSTAVFAQSVGGGGGKGASVISKGVLFSEAIGGAGGQGGKGGTATISQGAGTTGSVTTGGDRARGVMAQSVGGGGGVGGSAQAEGFGIVTYSHAVGGTGGTGGSGGSASVDLLAPVSTAGRLAEGVVAHSVGGGGGVSGGVLDFGASFDGLSIAHTVGGAGGGGGAGGPVSLTTAGSVGTTGHHAFGLDAQSIGGGGGTSGTVVSGDTGGMLAVTATVGGAGGQGGDGGAVTLSAAGAVSTAGDGAKGARAVSTGGGGGHAGTVVSASTLDLATLKLAIGGTGGSGGDGAKVKATTGAVTTTGAEATGVTALSIGGGGGSGSFVSNATALTVGDFELTFGGDGGGGGAGGAVTVESNGAISTAGKQSEGIHAASLGRFGGTAGAGLGAATANAVNIGSVDVTLGGSGGAGGGAADVSVATSGDVTTQGAQSTAILAQSHGGGGGRALGSATANVLDIGNVAVTVGGAGGAGAKAGDVSVTTAAGTDVSTSGVTSRGILAQSTGGTGGLGGFAAELSANIAASGDVSGQLGVTIGGGGGAGGTGGDVLVTNKANVTTGDYSSDAIFAQSIGGAGGAGGAAYAGNLNIAAGTSPNLDVVIGGAGGAGAASGTVTVNNSGAITTDGYDSSAIFAHSVGGNGGRGGQSLSTLVQLGSSMSEAINVTIGGSGGGGAVAKSVSVTNSGTIRTGKGGSDGIYGQSVGGNGGRGGSDGYIGFDINKPGAAEAGDGIDVSVNVNVGVGGSGGKGADADTVTIANIGDITTAGNRARGIVAQSVGGGGGDGGTSSGTAFAVSDICNIDVVNLVCGGSDEEDTTSFSINSTVQVGGSGGASGNGAAVTVSNSGDITTSGQIAHAIYAQSVGGGGGNGGEGGLGIDAWTSNKTLVNISNAPSDFLPSFGSVSIAVGGTAGAAGDGAAVQVTNTGALTLNGPDASVVARYTGIAGGPPHPLTLLEGGTAIRAQSVGGGGGDGGAGSSGLTALATVGQSGSGGGDGGDVTVTNGGVIRNASGAAGVGIFAQSVGGGGGTAGDVTLGWTSAWGKLNIGAGLGIQGDGGVGGAGGKVVVKSNGAITTTGQRSHGIIAQSVGGSGGIAGISPSSDASVSILVGSRGAAGDGGDVNVAVTAPITVSGATSVGVAAHSAGGTAAGNQSGTVTIDVGADIAATGSGGRGLLVGSASYQNQATGDVLVTVADGASVVTGAGGSEVIGVLGGGAGSTITNNGTVTSGNDAGYAIRVSTPNAFAITNNGMLTGSVLGDSETEGGASGAFAFANAGTFNAGSEVTLLGTGSAFVNTGVIAPGGSGAIANTILASETVTLPGTGTYAPDFDPSQPVPGGFVAADALVLAANDLGVTGAKVAPVAVISQPGKTALTGEMNILDSNQSFAAGDFTAVDTGAVTYRLATSTSDFPGTALLASYVIDTTPWARADAPTRARLNANHDRFGRYVETLLTRDPEDTESGAFIGALGGYVLGRPDVAALVDTYDAFIAEEVLAVPDATLFSNLAFAEQLQGCPAAGQDVLGVAQADSCAWIRFQGRESRRRDSSAGMNYDETVGGVTAGGRSVLGDWTLGGGLGWEQGSLSMSNTSGDVTRLFAGLMLARDIGPATFSASLSGGSFQSEIDRSFSLPGGARATASSDPDGGFVAAHLRYERRIEHGEYYLRPIADLGLTWLSQNSFTESGAQGYGLRADRLEQTVLTINPQVEFGHEFAQGGRSGIASLRMGVVGLIGSDPSIEAAFIGAGDTGVTFGIQNQQADLLAQFGGALDLALSATTTIQGNLDALLAEDQYQIGAGLRVEYRF